ncbi:hypothetical protein DRJ48_00075 [Candidatus Woesearchaeota archaeon]|nr:hypothetical protein [Candidatus Woesearchaeota archaeon]RLE43726.1 MAG: hypothetical protein DRJ48_00075 [Candidatus Woesearchaeota archaeon]
MDNVQEINVSLETLFEMLRLEKKRGEIQPLPPTFLQDLRAYIQKKRSIIQNSTGVSQETVDRARRQLENVFRIIEELFGVREKKVIELARLKANRSMEALEGLGLIEEEVELYRQMTQVLKSFRHNLVTKIKQSDTSKPHDAQTIQPKPEPKIPVNKGTMRVLLLKPLPRFVGEGFKVYGPYNEGDSVELPSNIAELLIKKGHAKEFSANN